MDAKRIEVIRKYTENPDPEERPYWFDSPVCALADGDEQITYGEVRELLAAYEALQRVAEIADDFHPDSDRDAPLALQEMRDALQQALPESLRN